MNLTHPRDRQARQLAKRLARQIRGEVHGDAVTRAMYATDASIYQVVPLVVAMPLDAADVAAALSWARREGIPVTPRGAGTSQGGQAIGPGLVLDLSRHLHGVLSVDVAARTAVVQPGLVLDDLNRHLRDTGLFFPVDVATGSRATLGGMAGNNSAGARSILHGHMVDNVRALHALLPDGSAGVFGTSQNGSEPDDPLAAGLAARLGVLRRRESEELARRIPDVPRHVAGYNLHRVGPDGTGVGDILVGSEGTLALFTALELALAPRPPFTGLAVCRFASLGEALRSVPTLVGLEPSAVELVDGTVIERAWALPQFRTTVEKLVRDQTRALLFVEVQGKSEDEIGVRLSRVETALRDFGHPGAVVRAVTAEFQSAIWSLRRAGMNLVMRSRSARKPVSFLEDCVVPIDRLAEYAERVTAVFEQHGTTGTWYAHASVGCLHVRPALDLHEAEEVARMRAIAEEMLEIVRDLGGSHSGEHGDGRVRSEFLEPMLGPRLVRAFEETKAAFDPGGVLNPGVLVNPPAMDDRQLLRYPPGYRALPVVTGLDWSEHGSFLAASEACNNNGQCRKREPGVMCPSYRATGEERHVTRGRANALRMALSGQLGEGGLTDDWLYEALDLCVGCKACRSECPAGVDVARMKIEVLHQRRQSHGLDLRSRMLGHLPRIAPYLSRLPALANLPSRSRWAARVLERTAGLSRGEALPRWNRSPWTSADLGPTRASPGDRDVVLFVDTFTRWFEPENARAAARVLRSAGYEVREITPDRGRPFCCGRTYLSAGMVEEAREEALRFHAALKRAEALHTPVVGLEPSCVLTLRDEWPALLPGTAVPERPALLFEEFLVRERAQGRLSLPLRGAGGTTVRVHSHCHQKAFGLEPATAEVLGWIPELRVEPLPTGCCGMAGSFGYEAEHADISRAMAEDGLLPHVSNLPESSTLVANGSSCRHQIQDLAGRGALHVARVLDEAIDRGT